MVISNEKKVGNIDSRIDNPVRHLWANVRTQWRQWINSKTNLELPIDYRFFVLGYLHRLKTFTISLIEMNHTETSTFHLLTTNVIVPREGRSRMEDDIVTNIWYEIAELSLSLRSIRGGSPSPTTRILPTTRSLIPFFLCSYSDADIRDSVMRED